MFSMLPASPLSTTILLEDKTSILYISIQRQAANARQPAAPKKGALNIRDII